MRSEIYARSSTASSITFPLTNCYSSQISRPRGYLNNMQAIKYTPATYSTDRLHVKVQTPEKVLWEGEADAVTSRNSAGVFDILPEHANFISMLEAVPIEIIIGKESKEF